MFTSNLLVLIELLVEVGHKESMHWWCQGKSPGLCDIGIGGSKIMSWPSAVLHPSVSFGGHESLVAMRVCPKEPLCFQ